MLIPDKFYSIFGFINTWKPSYEYIILHYLSVWNVGWSSYHVGCIVNCVHYWNKALCKLLGGVHYLSTHFLLSSLHTIFFIPSSLTLPHQWFCITGSWVVGGSYQFKPFSLARQHWLSKLFSWCWEDERELLGWGESGGREYERDEVDEEKGIVYVTGIRDCVHYWDSELLR